MTDRRVEPYAPRRGSRTASLAVRGHHYRLREWGPADARPRFFLHGARDASPTFQFLVDLLPDDWRIVAPDWRGHGGSDRTPGSYWQADFALDLDVILDAMSPGESVDLVGHSMGGNIATLYAGLRPQRVRRLVILDALGSQVDADASTPMKMLDTMRRLQVGRRHRTYETVEAMAQRLRRANSRLDPARAAFLAEALVTPVEGGFTWPHDPTFVRSMPTLHDAQEWSHCWRQIRATSLLLVSADPRPTFATSGDAAVSARAAWFTSLRWRRVAGTGHNLHHDDPVTVAREIAAFLAEQGAVPAGPC